MPVSKGVISEKQTEIEKSIHVLHSKEHFVAISKDMNAKTYSMTNLEIGYENALILKKSRT